MLIDKNNITRHKIQISGLILTYLASLLRKSSNSHRFELLTLGYTTLKRAHAEVRLVNQSPVARRCNNGLKYFSIASVVWSGASFLSASTALSRTTVSSTFFQKWNKINAKLLIDSAQLSILIYFSLKAQHLYKLVTIVNRYLNGSFLKHMSEN